MFLQGFETFLKILLWRKKGYAKVESENLKKLKSNWETRKEKKLSVNNILMFILNPLLQMKKSRSENCVSKIILVRFFITIYFKDELFLNESYMLLLVNWLLKRKFVFMFFLTLLLCHTLYFVKKNIYLCNSLV